MFFDLLKYLGGRLTHRPVTFGWTGLPGGQGFRGVLLGLGVAVLAGLGQLTLARVGKLLPGRGHLFELDPVRLVFYNLMTNEAVAATRDAKALKETKEKIAEVADLIRAREFSPKPGFGCGYCDYKPLCPAHEQLISIRPGQLQADSPQSTDSQLRLG